MASTTSPPRLPTWEELDRITADATRFVDLCVVYRLADADNNPTGPIQLVVGGVWDKCANGGKGGYDATRRPKRCKIWGVSEAQRAYLDALAEWLEKRDKGDAREVVFSLSGPRGGGKTDAIVKAAAIFNIKFPGSNAWIYSPTLDRREEVEAMWKDWIPRAWAKNSLRWPTSIPDCRFRLINDSSTRSLTAEIASNAKRGDRVEFIGLNEAQLMRRRVFSMALPGVRRNGGLLMAAHNPPQDDFPAGEWVVDLVEKADAGKRWLRNCWIDPRLNPFVSSSTMQMVGEALADVDAASHAADVRGDYKRLGEFVYSKFRPTTRVLHIERAPGINATVGATWATDDGDGVVTDVDARRIRIELPSMVRPTPDTPDITNEALRRAKWTGRQTVAIGCDFQTRPHQAAAAIKVYPHVVNGVATGKYVYQVADEILVWGSSVSEAELSHALFNGDGAQEIEYTPDSALLVPDCSGGWQKANRQPGASSKGEMEALGWKCKPPTEIKQPDKSSNPTNPPVHRSIALLADVMREGRFFVDPACKWVIEAGPKVPYKKDGDKISISQAGGFAHVWDCIRYVIWLLEPKTKKQARPLRLTDITALPVGRTNR